MELASYEQVKDTAERLHEAKSVLEEDITFLEGFVEKENMVDYASLTKMIQRKKYEVFQINVLLEPVEALAHKKSEEQKQAK